MPERSAASVIWKPDRPDSTSFTWTSSPFVVTSIGTGRGTPAPDRIVRVVLVLSTPVLSRQRERDPHGGADTLVDGQLVGVQHGIRVAHTPELLRIPQVVGADQV